MERITAKMSTPTPDGGHAVPTTFVIDFVLQMPAKDFRQFQAMVDRLAEYEDTGLTPAEIMEMRAELERIYTALA